MRETLFKPKKAVVAVDTSHFSNSQKGDYSREAHYNLSLNDNLRNEFDLNKAVGAILFLGTEPLSWLLLNTCSYL